MPLTDNAMADLPCTSLPRADIRAEAEEDQHTRWGALFAAEGPQERQPARLFKHFTIPLLAENTIHSVEHADLDEDDTWL